MDLILWAIGREWKENVILLQEVMCSWEVVNREDWMNVLPSTWAFKCKRFPNGDVRN